MVPFLMTVVLRRQLVFGHLGLAGRFGRIVGPAHGLHLSDVADRRQVLRILGGQVQIEAVAQVPPDRPRGKGQVVAAEIGLVLDGALQFHDLGDLRVRYPGRAQLRGEGVILVEHGKRDPRAGRDDQQQNETCKQLP